MIPNGAHSPSVRLRKAVLSLIAIFGGLSLSLLVPAGQKSEGSRTVKITAALATPVNISRSSSPSADPVVGVDGSGNAYAVWFEYSPNRAFYFATNKSGSWSSPYQFE